MKRIEASINQPDCLISGYMDKEKVVLVIVNAGKSFQLERPKAHDIKTYTTTANQNLSCQKVNKRKIDIPEESVVSLVIEREN